MCCVGQVIESLILPLQQRHVVVQEAQLFSILSLEGSALLLINVANGTEHPLTWHRGRWTAKVSPGQARQSLEAETVALPPLQWVPLFPVYDRLPHIPFQLFNDLLWFLVLRG